MKTNFASQVLVAILLVGALAIVFLPELMKMLFG